MAAQKSLDPAIPSELLPGATAMNEDTMALLRGIVEAERITSPHGLAAQTLKMLFGANSDSLEENMTEAAKAINGGSLVGVEGSLASQAIALNAMFHRLAQVSFEKPRTADDFSAWFKLALRAQAQSANALAVLANLQRGPSVVVTGQLNAAHQQVIHNGPAPMKLAEGRASASRPNSRKRRQALQRDSNPLPDAFFQSQPAKQHATLDG